MSHTRIIFIVALFMMLLWVTGKAEFWQTSSGPAGILSSFPTEPLLLISVVALIKIKC